MVLRNPRTGQPERKVSSVYSLEGFTFKANLWYSFGVPVIYIGLLEQGSSQAQSR
jgi:hypothetical protein